MANFIALTHLVNNKPAPIYVNVDQICRIGDSVGGGPGYATDIVLAQGQMSVRETVAQVMQIINAPNAPAMAAAPKLTAMAPRAAAKPAVVEEAAGMHPRRRSKRK
jgi:hypothetical protein